MNSYADFAFWHSTRWGHAYQTPSEADAVREAQSNDWRAVAEHYNEMYRQFAEFGTN